MTYWEKEELEDQALCGSDVKAVDQFSEFTASGAEILSI